MNEERDKNRVVGVFTKWKVFNMYFCFIEIGLENMQCIKKIVLIWSIYCFFFLGKLYAQENTYQDSTNLVTNPGFEDLNDCPLEYGDISEATGWLGVSFTPDLFSGCDSSSKVGVPQNFFGSQFPAEGEVYAGILAYHERSPLEYIATNLTMPLVKGEKYHVRFRVSLAELYSNYACNNIGLAFTNNPSDPKNISKVHVKAEKIVSAGKSWVTISKTILADDDYSFLIIGNFSSKEKTDTRLLKKNAFPAAYYYIDDIRVSKYVEESDEENFIKVIGTIYDEFSKKPLPGRIDFVLSQIPYRAFELSDSITGKYEFSNMQRRSSFYLEVKSKGYYSKRVLVERGNGEKTLTQDFYLKPSKLGTSIVLENILFDLSKTTLKPESYPELNMITTFLLEHPHYHIEISGHTDSKGDAVPNQELSEARAGVIVQYLHEKGLVPIERMVFKGYGEVQPIATNSTEAGRRKNRRVELKIIKDLTEEDQE